MIDDVQKMMDTYFSWLREKTVLKQLETQKSNDWVRITTPHLDRHNDCLQIYVRPDANGWTLTDDGATIEDLISCGCNLDTPKRRRLLEQTINSMGVQFSDSGEDLVAHATSETFAIRKHGLLQAMLAVNDLFYLAQPHVASLFYEDVVMWLDGSGVRYTPKVKFTGKSGYDHMFDFVLPKFRDVPERFVQVLTNPTRDAVGSVVYRWLDTRGTRDESSKLYVMMNDADRVVHGDAIEALQNYKATPVLWSKRESVREKLAA